MENAGDTVDAELPLAECLRLARLALDDGGADEEWTACQRAIGYVRAVARNPEATRECLPLGAALAFMTKHAGSLRSSLALCGIQGLADVLARLTSPAWDEFGAQDDGAGLDAALDAALQVLLQKQSSADKKFLADASAQALSDVSSARPCALLLRKLVRKRVSKNAKLVAVAAHWALCVARALSPAVLAAALLDAEPDALEDVVEMANGRSAEARPLALEVLQLARTALGDDDAFRRRLCQLWPDASDTGAKVADLLHKLAPPQPVAARVPIRMLRAANHVDVM